MSLPENRIVEFILEHHVLTLATSKGNTPWCANCFYVYMEDINALVFTSDKETRHSLEMVENEGVAGSIVLETSVIGKIQGIQFQGKVSKPSKDLEGSVKKNYLKKYPVAMLMKTNLWVLELSYIKMTDNRLGFGKKLIWEADSE